MTGTGAVCSACGAPLVNGQQFCTRCGTSAVRADPLRDRLQELLGTELQVLDVVGQGGMAVVYAARDPLLERRVAIKAMLPEFAQDREMADRFLREARTAAQLQHPNIVSVFGARSKGDLLVMLMAFVEGRSLDKVLHERGPLPLPIAGRLAADVASALQYAHEHKVIHRDVKPANVLLASNGGALVSDFGIARRQDVPGLTGEGMLLGSLSYMSPEQRYGEILTGATDQYALAVSMFEMLAGRGPFVGPPIDQHVAHLKQAPPSVREFRADVPEPVANALARMLAKDPKDRFPDLREPKRIFEKLVTGDGRSVSAEIAQLSGVLAAPTASRVMSAVRKAPTLAITNATPRESSVAAPVVAAPDAVSAPTTITQVSRPASRAPIYAAVVVGALIFGGAVMMTRRMNAPVASSGSAPTATVADTPAAAAAANGPSQPVAPDAGAANTASRPVVGGAPPVNAPVSPGVALPPAALSRPQEPSPTVNTAPTPAPASPPAAEAAKPAAPSVPAATRADASAAARAFLTMLNQHRARDVERLGDAGDGEAAARASLEKNARESSFAAGFAAMPSSPEMDGAGFITEFTVLAEWRSGGKDQSAEYAVKLRVARSGDGWVAVAYSVR